MNPIHFNVITFISHIKMCRFCQTPAYYRGFSPLSEGFTFEILPASMLVNSWEWGGFGVSQQHLWGAAVLSPGLVGEDGSVPRAGDYWDGVWIVQNSSVKLWKPSLALSKWKFHREGDNRGVFTFKSSILARSGFTKSFCILALPRHSWDTRTATLRKHWQNLLLVTCFATKNSFWCNSLKDFFSQGAGTRTFVSLRAPNAFDRFFWSCHHEL